jgi:hypothetical protein
LGTLEISFGSDYNTVFATGMYSILFRNLQIETIVAKGDVSEIDLSIGDVLYSNTNKSDTDENTTFYMYSTNEKSGRGQLFLKDTDHPLDLLTYYSDGEYYSEKPELHWIRIITKSISKSKIYKDIFNLSDIKMNYKDRYFNSGRIDLQTGIIEAEYVKSNMQIKGDL